MQKGEDHCVTSLLSRRGSRFDDGKIDCGKVKAKKAKIDADGERKEQLITSGADIVIKNVLPFLQLE